MSPQIIRNNHYVPLWYQRGFLEVGETKLHRLDLAPDRIITPDGRAFFHRALSHLPPAECFRAFDLYTTRFGPVLNDEIERRLFGLIDDHGARAVRSHLAEDALGIHEYFEAFFEYLDAQKLRTPKGLDWIRARYPKLSQMDLMLEMQAIRFMHCGTWGEGVREIVSAKKADIKFLISDHPVTVYNAACPTDSAQCGYPDDPPIIWKGSQTLFPLDANHLLILTNLEYAQEPSTTQLKAPRTNARYYGGGLMRTDAFIRGRELGRDDVLAINHVLKSRAGRYVAAGKRDWLYPVFAGKWEDIAGVLLPKDGIWQFGGEIFVGYKDGSSKYQDAYGRTSRSHEYLRKERPASPPDDNHHCGCGSGKPFGQCCKPLAPNDRPSWDVRGIRERNLMLCRAVERILELDKGKTWDDIRRNLSADQVKRIHEAYGSLWPTDTDLVDLLPRPSKVNLRCVYVGQADPATLAGAVTAWLYYFDEIVVANPFVNPNLMRPEFSPTSVPEQYIDQTLRNVLALLILEPFIFSGQVHLIPNPGDFNHEFLRATMQMSETRKPNLTLGAAAEAQLKARSRAEFERANRRLPEGSLKRQIAKVMPNLGAEEIEKLVAFMKKQLLEDPISSLQPLGPPGKDNGQMRVMKGYSVEVALYLAALTGSAVYTELLAVWEQIVPYAKASATASELDETLSSAVLPVEFDHNKVAANADGAGCSSMRRALHALYRGLAEENSDLAPLVADVRLAARVLAEYWTGKSTGTVFQSRLEALAPKGGIELLEVRRLLITFGRASKFDTVPLALLVRM